MTNTSSACGTRSWAVTALLAAALAGGCQTGSVRPLARWRMAFDQSLASAPKPEEIGDTKGLLGRWMSRGAPGTSTIAPKNESMLVLGSDGWSPMKPPSDPVADAEFAAADKLLQERNYAEAEKAFARIARRRKGTHWGEKAQFYLAECQYHRGKLLAAHDSYEALVKTYTGTQYLDQAVQREFDIACAWLAMMDPDAKPEQKARWGDRWRGRQPPIDTAGYALAALEHVRHNDPNGPLADDAAMKIADHHYKNGNWEEASLYYDEVITEYPKSPLIQQALLSSIDSKLKGYLGPSFDASGLEKARDQVIQTMASFPEQQAAHSESLYHVLEVINEQMAERAYKAGEHYLWTGKVAAAEYCFGSIPVKWPKSPYAAKAKEQLAQIATMPRTETQASRIMTRPGSSDPLTGGAGIGAGGIGPNGMGMGLGGMGLGGP